MVWTICLAASIFIFIVSAIIGRTLKINDKKSALLTNRNVFLVGVFLAAWVVFFPTYFVTFAGSAGDVFKAIFVSAHTAIRLFVIDIDFAETVALSVAAGEVVHGIYSIYCAILFVLAPILTFGFILSFFKNLSAYKRLLDCYFCDLYVFSQLNEKTLAMAESIRKNDKRAALVFANMYTNEEGAYDPELLQGADRIGSINFVKDIAEISIAHSKKTKIEFFIIGENQTENLNQTLSLVEKYKERKNTKIYLFDSETISDVLLSNLDSGELVVRRINDAQLFIYQLLLRRGVEMFKNAMDENGEKYISAVIVGLGRYGLEMFKALCWAAQVEGYRLKIDCFDKDQNAADRLKRMCPEIFSPMLNGQEIEGEAYYQVKVHSGIDVHSSKFYEKLSKLKTTTMTFVSLGSDKENMQVAVELREKFERMGALKSAIHPLIYTVIYNHCITDTLMNAKHFGRKGKPKTAGVPHAPVYYQITPIGDIKDRFDYYHMFRSDLEEKALALHAGEKPNKKDKQAFADWEKKAKVFYKYEYYYRSSMASVIHGELLRELKKLGWANSKWSAEEMEHKRWNAYMRSEGYVYSGKNDAATRNDLGKIHHDLCPYKTLTDEEREKDKTVIDRKATNA